MDHSRLIADEIYDNLKARFLHTGKGRPKSLRSDILVNNRLLVQLQYLHSGSLKPWSVINEWLTEIDVKVGDLATSSTHLFNLVQRTAKLYHQIQDEASAISFLDTVIDLDFISDSLSDVGITKQTFMCPPENDPQRDIPIQVFVDLEAYRNSQRLPLNSVITWINKLTGIVEKKLPYAIKSTYDKYQTLNKSKHKDKVNVFLASLFLKSTTSPSPSPSPSSKLIKNTTTTKACDKCAESSLHAEHLMDTIRSLQEEKADLQILKLLRQKINNLEQIISEQNKEKCVLEEKLKLSEDENRRNQSHLKLLEKENQITRKALRNSSSRQQYALKTLKRQSFS